MIVSYSRNFIFIKTKKTAGTTVEAVLASGCGPGDIVPKAQDLTYPGSGLLTIMREGQKNDGSEESSKTKLKPHMSAQELRELAGLDFWNTALKITVERHPYEKAVSLAYYRIDKRPRQIHSFPVFLDRTVRKGDYSGFDLWSINGEVAVDVFIRHETLETDLERVTKRLGISLPEELPAMKTRTRKDKRPAREILSDLQKEIVYERCKREFEFLGYER